MSVPLRKHLEIVHEVERAGDMRFTAERDRRYAEVDQEREKALKIKETADLAALELAREIQTYKDEKANELRSQIERERGGYATKDELKAVEEKLLLAIQPLATFVAAQGGGDRQANAIATQRNRASNLTLAVIGAVLTLLLLVVGAYAVTHGQTSTPAITVVVPTPTHS